MTPEEKKEADKRYQTSYKEKNREKLAQQQADYRATHKEEAAAYQRKYYLENKEKFVKSAESRPDRSAYHKKYYEENKEKLRSYGRTWYKENGKKFQEDQRNKVSLEQEAIAGRPRPETCEVCGGVNHDRGQRYGTNLKTVFDHDHVTGKFRGFLCDACNTALGLLKDNPETLRKLADYLTSR